MTSNGTAAYQKRAWNGGSSSSNPRREQTIARLAVLKAAASFAANKEIKSGDVLLIAERWLEWINK